MREINARQSAAVATSAVTRATHMPVERDFGVWRHGPLS
ncbi:hypothetical protein CBM2599_B51021 [Cupriavidus taiwanensis]|nr:hypothetical protein CBM2599_B51021 [Cupriavidus taiwanensis]SOY99997.1 hypothetical protein CBM2600_B70031 [Cupriavidus taiwanensis]